MELQNCRTLSISHDESNLLFILRDVLRKNCKKNENYLFSIEKDEQYKDLFYEYKPYTIDEIIEEIQKEEGLLLDRKTIQDCLTLLVILGEIVIIDNLDQDNAYKCVPRNLRDSGHTRNYCEINLGSAERLILISDTHIGDSEHEDFDMINSVIDYAKSTYGIDTALHLGDVFHGVKLNKGKYMGYSVTSKEIKQILEDQLDKFDKFFPKCIKVLAIAGNHDDVMIDCLNNKNFIGHSLGQLYLSMLNQNFHMLKGKEWGYTINGQNIKINLSHPLTYNMFFPYVKTYEIDKEGFASIFKDKNPTHVDLFLSGHFHFNMSYNIMDDNNITQRIYEVIPSLSRLSQDTEDKCVSKIIRFIRDELGNITHYGITPLYYVDDKVIEGEEVIHPTNSKLLSERNKTYYLQ